MSETDRTSLNIQRQLRENNPFSSSAAPIPWDNTNPDVTALNWEVEQNIYQLLRTKRRNPSLPLAGLVLGEAGVGKTHMLKRLLHKTQSCEYPTLFVSVRAFNNPGAVMRDLLREIFINLNRKCRKEKNQLSYLTGELLARSQKNCIEDGFSANQPKDLLRYLRSNTMPGVNEAFLRVFLLYAMHEDNLIRQEALYWLMGECDDAHPELLSVADRSSMDDVTLEAEAQSMILSLGYILKYTEISMLICFDQLDGMTTDSLINAWGQVIHLLVNDVSGILPIAFLRAGNWNVRFRKALDDSVVQRFNNPEQMENCSYEQACELLRSRLKFYFGDDHEDKFLWIHERIKDSLDFGYPPRRIIDLANRAILKTEEKPDKSEIIQKPHVSEAERTEDEIVDTLKRAYQEEWEKVASEPDNWPFLAEHLERALELWLNSRDEFEEVSKTGDKNVPLKGRIKVNGSSHDCLFAIPSTRNHNSASSALNKCINFLQQQPEGYCFFITEIFQRTWNKAHQELKEFKAKKGKALILNTEQRVAWYALVSLQNKLNNGDISLYLTSGSRQADKNDLTCYIRRGFPGDILGSGSDDKEDHSGGEKLNDDRTPKDEEALKSSAIEIINQSPMKIMKAAFLLDALKTSGSINKDYSYESFLAWANQQKDTFGLYSSSDGSLVRLMLS